MSRKGIKRLLLLVTVLIVVSGGLVTAVFVRGSIRDRHNLESRDEGLRLTEAGSYEDGLLALSPYIARVKDDYDASLAYAKCRAAVPLPNNKHASAAVAAAKLAIAAAPDRPEAHEFLITIYGAMKLQTELLETCDALLAIDPTNENAFENKIYALISLDRLDAAGDAAELFIAARPESLRAYGATMEVMRARGATAEQLNDFLRGDAVAERLGDQPEYLLRLVGTAIGAVEATGNTVEYFQQAVDAARRASEMMPGSPQVALQTTSFLHRLGLITGDVGLIEHASETIDRFIAQAGLGDGYIAAESRAAWWRIENDRATQLALRIDPQTEDPAALGWLYLLAESNPEGTIVCEDCVSRLAAIGSRDAEFWGALGGVEALRNNEGETRTIFTQLDAADEAALVLDARDGGTEHHQFVALVRGQVFLRTAQLDSARAELEAVSRPGARLLLVLSEVYTQQGDITNASDVLLELEQRGIVGAQIDAVVGRYTKKRLSAQNFDDARVAAEHQLARVSEQVEQDPENPSLVALHARLLLVAGQTENGLAQAGRLLELGAPDDLGELVELANVVYPYDQSLSRSLVEFPEGGAAGSIELVTARAILLARAGETQEGLNLFDSILISNEADKVGRDIARVRYMEELGLPGVVDALGAISEDYAESARAQTAVLSSRLSWDNEELIRSAVARLRTLTGASAIEWRVAGLRADLKFIESFPEQQRDEVLSKTILELTQISGRVPQNTDVLRLIALAYDLTGQPADAIRMLRRSVTQSPELFADLISMLQREGLNGEVNDELDSYLLVPVDVLRRDLIRRRADLLESVGRAQDSLPDRYILAGLGRVADVASLGYALVRSGDPGEARSVALRLAENNPSPEAVRSAARILIEAGDPDEAVGVYVSSMTGLSDADKYVELGRILAAYAEWERASKQVQLALDTGAKGIAPILLAHTLLEMGDADAALAAITESSGDAAAALRSAIGPADGLANSRLMLGQILAAALVSGVVTDARVAELITEHITEGTSRKVLISDMEILAAQPGASASQILWKTRIALLRETDPADPRLIGVLDQAARSLGAAWPLRELVGLHLMSRNFEQAEDAANRYANAVGVQTFDSDTLLARVAIALDRPQEALDRLLPHRDRLIDNDADPMAAAVFVSALAATGRAGEAESLIESRLANDAGAVWLYLDAAGWLPLAETQMRRVWLDRLDAAVDSSEQPYLRGWARVTLASSSKEPGDAERAIGLLGEIPEAQSDITLAIVLASLEQTAGRPGLAAERFEQLLAEHPRNAQLLNNYAFLLATGLGRADEADRLIDQAIGIAREDELGNGALGTLLHTRAVVYREQGDLEAAERILKEGIGLAGPPMPEMLIELSEVLIELDRAAEVENLIDQVPANSNLPKYIEDRLRSLADQTP